MAEQEIRPNLGPEAIRRFAKTLLHDLRALEQIIAEGRIESDRRRIGVEQEMFLVGEGWHPAPIAVEVLEELEDEAFTTELARFNLEVNLEPLEVGPDCLRTLEERVRGRIEAVREAARGHGGEVVLTGILPTLSKSDLSLENITPRPRYYALNDAITRMRGQTVRLRIEGTDELHIEHDSVMLEACNTSFQVHLQVADDEFAAFHNVSQALAGPVLAAAVNSPLLFGKRLWAETRIALFQQSVDTRSASPHLRELSPRVHFGEDWVDESVLELFQDDIARYRILMATEVDEDPLRILGGGGIPELQALQLHNGTVYRWNRPCYGITDGEPHLRIECRTLPAGPTVLDEVANAAFWIGTVLGGVEAYGDVRERMDFDDAKANFLAAARHGLQAGFTWMGGEVVAATELILRELLPIARDGLASIGVDEEDVNRYLGIIEARVGTGSTGAQWLLRSAAEMRGRGTRAERLGALASAIAEQQHDGKPVHEWKLARLEDVGRRQENYLRVEQYMSTDLYTVNEDELVDLVAFLMERKQVRQVLVEDEQHRLVGLVSYRSLLKLMATGELSEMGTNVPVKEIMERHPVTVTPETPTLEAIELMRDEEISCLPVVKKGKLAGIVTERDFMPIAGQLLEERLGTEEERRHRSEPDEAEDDQG